MSKQAREHKVLPFFITNIDEAEGLVDAVVNIFGIVDLGDDIIHNGAYTKTLNERGNKIRVKVLDSHNSNSIMNVLGIPKEIREIGRDELARIAPEVIRDHPEATGGLFTRTQYLLDTDNGREAFKRIASGAVNEYSIALDALETDYGKVAVEGKERVVRHIRALRLWEYSPVVFGMNQATVTTDVKAADTAEPDDKAAPAPEVKQGSLAGVLEAEMRFAHAFCVSHWIGNETVDSGAADMLNVALGIAMAAFRAALPESVAMMPILDYYGNAGGAELKAGAVLSAKNKGLIQQAHDNLRSVLDAATSVDEAPEQTDEKALTGPDGHESEPEPSIAMTVPEELHIDPADIEREFAELSVMMEMEHELQGDH